MPSNPIQSFTLDKPVAAPPTTAPPTAAPPATAPPLAPPSAQTGQDATKNLLKKLLRQYECSICYETMACSFSLSPCGDSFCYTCIKDWSEAATKCPLCQETFELKNSLPSKLSDNTIRDILSNDEAELKAWESRCSEGLANKRETDLGASSSSSSGIGIPIPPLSRATSRFTAGASSHHSTVSNISNVYNATHSNFVNLYHSSALPDQNVFGFNGRNVPATSLGVRSERKRKSNQMTIAPGTAAASSGDIVDLTDSGSSSSSSSSSRSGSGHTSSMETFVACESVSVSANHYPCSCQICARTILDTKYAVGVYEASSVAEKEAARSRPYAKWAESCHKWVHPSCLRQLNDSRMAVLKPVIQMEDIKFTEKMPLDELQIIHMATLQKVSL